MLLSGREPWCFGRWRQAWPGRDTAAQYLGNPEAVSICAETPGDHNWLMHVVGDWLSLLHPEERCLRGSSCDAGMAAWPVWADSVTAPILEFVG